MVESTDTAMLATIPKNEVSPERLKSFLERLRFEAIARKSALTEEEAGRLADEVKAGWWMANKHRFIAPTE